MSRPPGGRSWAVGSSSARTRARARHPAARGWAPNRARVLERLAGRARDRGAPWPRVAAAMVLLRGVAGDDRAAFARRLGVAEGEIDRLEQGLAPASAVPRPLRAVTDLVDWAWVDGAADGQVEA